MEVISTPTTEIQYVSDPLSKKRRIECKPELVISSLQRFYSTHPDIDKVMPYLNGESKLSLRIIDWFVTKYSRKSFVRYNLNGKEFIVYLSYKGQLKAYSKQYFDPNCRRERIMFSIGNGEPFVTTIGKLNFFRWALQSNVLDYIEEHEDEIRTGYNEFLKQNIASQKKAKNETAMSKSSIASSLSDISTSSEQSSEFLSIGNNTNAPISILNMQTIRKTRRRRTKQTPSSLHKLQVNTTPVMLEFN
jgi:hypothetical protein